MRDIINKIFGKGISEVLGTVTGVIEALDNKPEKMELLGKLKELETGLAAKALEHEGRILDAQRTTLEAEIKGESWLQRNWRPIFMVVCIYIVFHNYVLVPIVGITPTNMPDQLWTLITIGLGGYLGGRTVEKVAKEIVKK